MVWFCGIGCWPHGHQRASPITRGAWENMNMDMGDFLACKWPIMDADGKIGRREMVAKTTLDFSQAVHQCRPFIRFKSS